MAVNNAGLIFPANVGSAVNLNTGASIRGLESFTFMAWFKVGPNSKTAPTQSAYVERQAGSERVRFRFTPVAGKLQFGLAVLDGKIETSYTYATKWDDRWHHAAFTARVRGDRPTYQIFLDGIKVAEGSLIRHGDKVEKISDTAPAAITLGNHSRGGLQAANAWEGNLDEIIILKEATSQSAITEYINSKDRWKLDDQITDPANEPLKYYWSFDENSGLTTRDIRADLTGTLPNTSYWTKDRPFLGDGKDDTTPPSTPGNPVTSNITYDSFTASWSHSTDDVYVQFYQLQVSEFSNFSVYNIYSTFKRTSHRVTGLIPSVNYYWRVVAYDAMRNASIPSATRSLTTANLGDSTPPPAPTNLSSKNIMHDAFTIEYAPSAASDTAGYKLDISESPFFDSYVEGYRNRDIGNITTYHVFDVKAQTTYYVRLRAYDNFDNESTVESTTLRVDTLRQPDITPPQVVTLKESTGLSSKTVTLSWEEGVDDFGVMGYYVDISKSPVFEGTVTTAFHIWQNLDVGNYTDVRVEGLEEQTTYYWRVRAYDEAGNIGEYPEEPGVFVTLPASIYEAGLMTQQHIPSDVLVSNTPVPQPDAEFKEYFIGPTSKLYLGFDLGTIVGTLNTAILTIIPKLKEGNTLGDIQIRVYPGAADSGALGQSLEYAVLDAASIHEIDITSLFTGGAGEYTVELSSKGFVGYIDTGSEVEGYQASPTGEPILEVSSDPNTSTQPLEMNHGIFSQERENLQINPSFEVNANSWRGIGDASVTIVSGGLSGHQAARITGTTASSGIDNAQTSAQMPRVLGSEWYTISFYMKHVSGLRTFKAMMYATDNLGANPILVNSINMNPDSDYTRYTISGRIPQNKVRLQFSILPTGEGAYSFDLDAVMLEKSEFSGAIFTGDSFGARWRGATQTSSSLVQGARFWVESPFLGDSNQNNTARAFFKHVEDGDDGWIESREKVSVDRTLNKYVTQFGPSYGEINLIRNPSFEADTLFWKGGKRVDTAQFSGDCSYEVLENVRAEYLPRVVLKPNTHYVIQARFLSDGGLSELQATLGTYNTTTGAITTTRTLKSEPVYGAVNIWQRSVLQFTTSDAEVRLNLSAISTKNYWLDAVQITPSKSIPPYRDGSILDGVWEGVPHQSPSGIQINGNESYITMFEYVDPEGFFDAENIDTFQASSLYIVPAPPDNVTTVMPLKLSASTDKIHVIAPYLGDDNENNSAKIEFKRADTEKWNEVRPTYLRKEYEVRANIPGLAHGTLYNIRVTFSDPDGLFGAPVGVIEGMITTDYIQENVEGAISITFGGFTLMGRDDHKIGVLSHDAFGFPDRRVELQELPRQDGAIERQSPWGAKTIRMEGFISGDTRAELADAVRSLKKALAPSTQKLIIDSLSKQGRYYNATCTKLDIVEDGKENISHLGWSAEFKCADPFAYDISEVSIESFTISNQGKIGANNGGDATAYPYIQITTTSKVPVSLNILNEITGDSIRPKTTIIDKDVLVIDCEKMSIMKNGVEVDYSGGFIRLSSGANTLEYTMFSSASTPSVQSHIRWRHRYL